jgi:acetoin utilization protein AcuB
MKLELVRDWMTHRVITVTPETTLTDAERLMVTKTIRRLPVLEDGRLVGIVTYGDIRRAQPSAATSLNIWELNYLLAKVKVSEIMTPNPVTVSQNATIGEAAQLMLNNMISGLPVVDGQGDLVGIITESDIFRLVVREWSGLKPEPVEPYARYY